MTRSTYIFFDEAGNFDFSSNGTQFFLLTCVSMRRPFPVVKELDNYKHECIENNANLEYFHCYNDSKKARRIVFDFIAAHLDSLSIDYLVVEKAAITAELQNEVRFYSEMLVRLIHHIVHIEVNSANADQIIVITDTIPINRKRRTVEKTVRTTLAKMLPTDVKYRILHHQSRSHYGLQIADYCCWAVVRKWQIGDHTWYDRIKPAIRTELQVVNSRAERPHKK